MLAVAAYNAKIGRTVFYALLGAVPTVIIGGPLFALLISKYVTPGSEQSAHGPVGRPR